jgi:SAM-dependent methyltransferase
VSIVSSSSAPGNVSDPAFWDDLYATAEDGWEQGAAAPPLARWFSLHPPTGRTALVIGCGRGHEARLVARAGAAKVVGIDFAQRAVEQARALTTDPAVSFERADIFDLARDPRRYDLVVEHCSFCAVDPARREEYARILTDVLVPNGQVVGLFYTHGRSGGPPFTTSTDELHTLFGRRLQFVHEEIPHDSIPRRAAQERLVVMQLQ